MSETSTLHQRADVLSRNLLLKEMLSGANVHQAFKINKMYVCNGAQQGSIRRKQQCYMAFTIFVYNASACGSCKRTVAGELLLLRGFRPWPEQKTGIADAWERLSAYCRSGEGFFVLERSCISR